MKGKKKQLLGFVGLALVFAMTAIAYSLPAPGAAAQDLNISVTVTDDGEEGSARIISPAPGAVFTGRSTTLSMSYKKIRSMSTTVKCTDQNGTEVYNKTEDVVLEAATGVANKTIEVPAVDSDVSCVAEMNAIGLSNEPYNDSVNFTFRAMNLPNPGTPDDPVKPPVNPDEPCEGPTCGKVDENNDPIVDVIVSDDVEKVTVQVYDTDNNPIFVDKDGNETPLVTTKDAFKDGKLSITLPMSEYNAKPGKYVAIFTATNGEGKIVSTNTYWFEYMPKVEAPGTGSIFKDLNLSRADYLLTGLVAFGAVAGFALYLVFRKSRR